MRHWLAFTFGCVSAVASSTAMAQTPCTNAQSVGCDFHPTYGWIKRGSAPSGSTSEDARNRDSGVPQNRQVPRDEPASQRNKFGTPAAGSAQAHYADGWNLYATRRYPEALIKFQQAAAAGHGQAATFVGDMYFDGKAGEPNTAEAVIWYGKAIELGSHWAGVRLAKLYSGGERVPRDDAEAAKWAARVAAGRFPKDEEESRAIYEGEAVLAMLLADGRGVPRDEKRAVALADPSTRGGYSALGARVFGILLVEGRGTPQDVKRGLWHLESAAKRGDKPAAQYLEAFKAGVPPPRAN